MINYKKESKSFSGKEYGRTIILDPIKNKSFIEANEKFVTYDYEKNKYIYNFTPFMQFDPNKNTYNFLVHKKFILSFDYKGWGRSIILKTKDAEICANKCNVFPKKDENGNELSDYFWVGFNPKDFYTTYYNDRVKSCQKNVFELFHQLIDLHEHAEWRYHKLTTMYKLRKTIIETAIDLSNLIKQKELWINNFLSKNPKLDKSKKNEYFIKAENIIIPKKINDPPNIAASENVKLTIHNWLED